MPPFDKLIKHNKFKDEKQKALVSILFAANVISNHNEGFLKPYGITCQQYNALRVLRALQPKPCTVNEIRENMIDRMSDTSRIVERLRKAGYAERVPSKIDKRAVDVVITQKGLDLLAKVDKRAHELEKPTVNLTNEEALTLNNIMTKVLDCLS